MKPKEKAEQLYNKCNPHCLTKSFYGDDIERQSTKQCAIIAVDEILDNFGLTTNGKIFYTEYRAIEYWQQVKIEIENL